MPTDNLHEGVVRRNADAGVKRRHVIDGYAKRNPPDALKTVDAHFDRVGSNQGNMDKGAL